MHLQHTHIQYIYYTGLFSSKESWSPGSPSVHSLTVGQLGPKAQPAQGSLATPLPLKRTLGNGARPWPTRSSLRDPCAFAASSFSGRRRPPIFCTLSSFLMAWNLVCGWSLCPLERNLSLKKKKKKRPEYIRQSLHHLQLLKGSVGLCGVWFRIPFLHTHFKEDSQ